MNKVLVLIIGFVHWVLICANTLCIPFLIYMEPWYISAPLITVICSPLVGGTYCVLYNLEDYYRRKAGMQILVHPDLSGFLCWRKNGRV